MDAILKRLGVLCTLCLVSAAAQGATFRTTNFVVTASTDDVARRVANCAEYWRRDLAIQWLGMPLPNWYQPCPISVTTGQMGAGGQTTFTFENGEVYGWKMSVQGSLERVLDSVIPHEVNHTIFASHFRRPLPRWADEGAATLFEHESEQAQQMQRLNRVLNTNRRIPLKDLLAIREYPPDMQDVLTLYAEGYSLAGFLVGSKGEQGRRVYLKFLEDAHKDGWERAIQRHYGYSSVALLEQQWTQWIVAGSPSFQPEGTALAQNDEDGTTAAAMSDSSPAADVVIRSQSPQGEEAPPAATAINEPVEAPAAIRGIPRQLRVARPHEEQDQVQAISRNSIRTASVENAWPRAEDFRPRALRQPENGAKPSHLSPTTDGITTDPKAKFYQFPEARR